MLGTRGIWHRAGSRTPCMRRPHRDGRTSTRTAGSCSTSRTTAANATTSRPSTRRSWPRCSAVVRRGREIQRSATVRSGRLRDDRALAPDGERRSDELHLLPAHRSGAGGGVRQYRGRSFSVLAKVRVDRADVRGSCLKQGAGHGGYVLFVEDGKLQFVYNFFGEFGTTGDRARPGSSWRSHSRVNFARPGRSRARIPPVGDVTLYRRGCGGDPARCEGPPIHVRPGRWGWRWAVTADSRCGPTARRSSSPAARSPRRWSTSGSPYVDRGARTGAGLRPGLRPCCRVE